MINLFIAASVLMWCIWFHEMGHMVYFKWFLNKNVELKFSFKKGFEIYFDESKHHSTLIYFWGIVVGALPLSIAYTVLPLNWNITLTTMYVAGSWYDIARMMRLIL